MNAITIAIVRWIATIFTVGAVGLALALAIWFFVNPDGFSDAFDDVNVVAVNTALGVFLITAGLALAIIGYVYQSVLTQATTLEEAVSPSELFKALAELLKQAGGLGVAVMLLGVILLTGTSLGDAANSTTQATTETTNTSSSSP